MYVYVFKYVSFRVLHKSALDKGHILTRFYKRTF